jgi:uncharacterized protein YjgD (DUF1641 family)
MAREIEYEVPPAPQPTAEDELAHFLEALHRSGTLRLLTGLVGKLGPVSDVALTEMKTPAGENIIGTLLFIAEILARIPAENLARLAQGFEIGFKRAERVAHQDPPGTWALIRQLREPDTRRTLAALIAVLSGVGETLAPKGSRTKSQQSGQKG